MRNFMSYDRRWLDEPHVGDHVGRSIWALGDVLSTAWVPAIVGPSQRLLAALVRSLAGELSIRTAAYATSASRDSTPTGSTTMRGACSSAA